MDGSERRVLVSEDLGLPNGLTMDFEYQQLCWADAGMCHVELAPTFFMVIHV